MATLKRSASSITDDESAKKANNNDINCTCICVDHSSDEKCRYSELSGKSVGDTQCNVKFLVEDTIIESHSEVLDIFSRNRQLVRDLIERDRQSARESNVSEANIFQMSGTTAQAFRCLLDYVYTGKAKCDHKCGIDLAITALKLKFQALAATIAKQFAAMSDVCLHCKFQLTIENVDDIYHIARNTECSQLSAKCGKMIEENCGKIKQRFLQRNCLPTDDANTLTFSLEKPRYCNYVHFKLPDACKICFNVKVSYDRHKWIRIVNNEFIFCNFWNWFYFREQRIKYIRITHTDADDSKHETPAKFNIRQLEDEYFLCKRANMELQFEDNYLIPKHDAIKYPIPNTVHTFAKKYSTYCISDASDRDKEKNYYYHLIGDGKSLEFYLPQNCLIDAIRFRLWDKDSRVYDFVVKVKSEENEDWLMIEECKDRRSWQTIRFPRLFYVRWISITGTNGPKHDPEFAVVHFECPPQNI